jgi:hypothetical protein
MKKNFSITLVPLPSFPETEYAPIISAWKDAGQHITDYQFSSPCVGCWNVSLDVSGVVDVLEASMCLEKSGSNDRFHEHALKWVVTGELVRITISVEASAQAFSSKETVAAALTAIVQELYLALNICAAGGGHFNGAVCHDSKDAQVRYYGDQFESAWALAYEWNWPLLQPLSFVAVDPRVRTIFQCS